MKFGRFFEYSIRNAWKSFYFDFHRLRKLITDGQNRLLGLPKHPSRWLPESDSEPDDDREEHKSSTLASPLVSDAGMEGDLAVPLLQTAQDMTQENNSSSGKRDDATASSAAVTPADSTRKRLMRHTRARTHTLREARDMDWNELDEHDKVRYGRYFIRAAEAKAFYNEVLTEYRKVDKFFQDKEQELAKELFKLIQETQMDVFDKTDSFQQQQQHAGGDKLTKNKDAKKRKKKSGLSKTELFRKAKVQRAKFKTLYGILLSLKSFTSLNYTAGRKLQKKFDKHLPCVDPQDSAPGHPELDLFALNKVSYLLKEQIAEMHFIDASGLDSSIFECEKAFARFFVRGNMKEAVLQLQRDSTRVPFWDMFWFGLNVGITLCVVFCNVVVDQISSSTYHSRFLAIMPILRVNCCLALFAWCWGILVYTWNVVNLNHVYIFDFNPASALKFYQVLKLASILTATMSISWFCYFSALQTEAGTLFGVKAHYYIMVLVVLFIAFLINPFDVFHRSTRMMLLSTVGQIVISPFSRVRFLHVYIADVITSLVHPLADLEYTFCYYLTGTYRGSPPDLSLCTEVKKYVLPLVCTLPYLWRGMQNVRRFWETGDAHPHLTNAGKYLSGIVVTIMGLLYGDFHSGREWDFGRVVWMILFVVEVLYMYSWDILMDWGFQPFSSDVKHRFLRDEIMYNKHAYYFAIVSNFFARFVWGMTITPIQFTQNKWHHSILIWGLSFCEILRRFQWSFFRVENEFLSNQSKLRSIHTVPMPNISAEASYQLEIITEDDDTLISRDHIPHLRKRASQKALHHHRKGQRKGARASFVSPYKTLTSITVRGGGVTKDGSESSLYEEEPTSAYSSAAPGNDSTEKPHFGDDFFAARSPYLGMSAKFAQRQKQLHRHQQRAHHEEEHPRQHHRQPQKQNQQQESMSRSWSNDTPSSTAATKQQQPVPSSPHSINASPSGDSGSTARETKK